MAVERTALNPIRGRWLPPDMTRLLILGGVAAGATAAARARRLDETAEITVVERGPYVSYANCGLPYFISGDIRSRSSLLLQTPEGFDARYGVKVHVHTEALELDRIGKRVRVRGPEGEAWLPYDRLVLAQGGSPVTPPIPGHDAPHVFRLWTVPDMDRLDGFLREAKPRTAVIVGGGFVGLEMAEALRRRGVETTVVELLPTVMSLMDREFGVRVGRALEANGVRVATGVGVEAVEAATRTVKLSDGRVLPADLVLFSVGVRPELAIARSTGLALGPSGALQVDDQLRTSDPAIWAAGDMIEVVQKVSGKRVRVPLAGPANRQGRIAATNALGGSMRYGGALGTSVVKIFHDTAAMTGLSERAAREAGLDVGVAVIHKDHHAAYYPGAQELSLKLVYERSGGRLVGAQAFGREGVEKRIDVLATALHGRMTLHDLAELDLAYAPPYSSANDPVNLAAFVGENDLSGLSPLVTAARLEAELASPRPPVVLDVRTLGEWERGHVKGATHLPVDDLRFDHEALPKGRRILVYCRSGFRAHLAVRILRQLGHADVANVTGGWLSLRAEGGVPLEGVALETTEPEKVPAEVAA
jgi:NADPH-dependent 2,4-dienoyl-CoA reductase/sulfur reductase-like enzyme/rhodanese-related sulfurtransferase